MQQRRAVEALYAESVVMQLAVKTIMSAILGDKDGARDGYRDMLDAWWPSKRRLEDRAEDLAPVIEEQLGRGLGVVMDQSVADQAHDTVGDLRSGFWSDDD